MLALLVVLFIAELWVIVQVASAIGVLQTIGLLFAITIIGIWLVKRQGMAVLGRLQATIDQGRVPHRELVDGFLILAAGILLIPPGFITDAIGSGLAPAAGAHGHPGVDDAQLRAGAARSRCG